MAENPINDAPETEGSCCSGHTLAFLLLRGWLGMRALLAGIEKFAANRTVQKPFTDPATGAPDPSGALIEVKEKFYAFTNYAAVPQSMKDRFAQEPLLPTFATNSFFALLGGALILLGLMLLLGLGTRTSLVLQGALYIVLSIGLILIRQDEGVAWLAIYIALIAMALMLSKHNRFVLLKKW